RVEKLFEALEDLRNVVHGDICQQWETCIEQCVSAKAALDEAQEEEGK
ncbi:hypothetical protein LCGC14_3088220, partial [marine sediment metagenome]